MMDFVIAVMELLWILMNGKAAANKAIIERKG
jgi:hypothetical protein